MTGRAVIGATARFQAPAKLNLALRVVGRRADGYHLLESWMVFFPLYDELSVTVTDGGMSLTCDPPVTGSVEENLVWRAARLLAERYAVSCGARLELVKQIPHGAGLGGGSSDAALTLLALNRLWGLERSLAELIELGVRLGADVPFFLGGRSAWVGGIGERLMPFAEGLTGALVLVFPGAGVATGRVFQRLNGRFPVRAAPLGMPAAGEGWIGALENDLEAPALEIEPKIGAARAALEAAGARATLMSGSGSTVFGVFPDVAQAMEAVAGIGVNHTDWRVFSGGILNRHPFHAGWGDERDPDRGHPGSGGPR
ncbi:Putative 4-diphosphocytidyl-2-C-methyl-D-erythritol kinase [Candidatus Magnetaquicoccaceae bacterium FCR-1]|uniref:4-diphosphocytidyl-2-C-methyl-D-erythritol kinase n=1 Tax=Candidatus Magnetaquiglobus chichijimensis TaxID=3141448 RepID=A0ABQ0C604_9PROT